VEAITYSLKGKNADSDRFYHEIAIFTDIFLKQAGDLGGRYFDRYAEYLAQREIRAREELCFEFLVLGILWNVYSGDASELDAAPQQLLSQLVKFREKSGSFKPGIDLVRGILSTIFLAPDLYDHLFILETNLENMVKLMDWLEATGELNTPANRSDVISDLLLTWYAANRRQLPWRKTADPYAIWLSEIMLQQTRVDTVIDYYLRFLRRFPDISSLAAAEEQEVLSLWKGLGYYTRARNLHRAAKLIQNEYRGVFPDSFAQIRALPGIGDYTAGAIASIAFNLPYPAVDGNVLRVISRLQEIEEDIGQPKTKNKITALVRDMIPEGRAGDFTQALMELGATCCRPSDPSCALCPLQAVCRARQAGKQNTLPRKKKAKTAAQLEYWAAVITNAQGAVLMEHRKNSQLLGNMRGLPLAEKESASSAKVVFEEKWGMKLKEVRKLGRVRHVFTHQIWKAEVILFALEKAAGALSPNLAWVSADELPDLPIPKAFQKMLNLFSS